jgi:hypothetical protein
MALRLNPDHPLVWRSTSALQFGVEEPRAVMAGVDATLELVLAAASSGVSRPVLDALAADRGLDPPTVARAVAGLSPVLGPPVPAQPLWGRRIVVEAPGSQAGAAEVGGLLGRMGAELSPPGSDAELVVLLSHYATSPSRAAAWLREDVPHLLVEFGDRSIRVGPVVTPGDGPCASCLELARAEEDAAWPAMAAQLVARRAPSADALGVAALTAVVGRVAVEHLVGGVSWRRRALRMRRPGFELPRPGAPWAGDAEASVSTSTTPRAGIAEASVGISAAPWAVVETVSAHPRCGCRSLPGSGRALGPPCDGSRSRPTRGAVVAGPG